MPYGVINADLITTSAAQSLGAGNATNFKNRLINGAMVIDQRNAGASVTQSTSGTYTLDRWVIYGSVTSKFTTQQNAGSVTPPAGFINYLGATSSSAYTVGSSETFVIQQFIEGLNCADLAWGTASAKTVTLSFQVYSSLTGTFGGALLNSAQNRSYPFNYTISSANTWTTVSVTIPGDTSGTWLTTNGIGVRVTFSLGTGSTLSGAAGAWSGSQYFSASGATSVVGTNGATWYITGVQLEVGSSASSFEVRSYGTELALCQRYFETSYPTGTAVGTAFNSLYVIAATDSSNNMGPNIFFKATKRATPTFTGYTDAGVSGFWNYGRNGGSGTTVPNPALLSANGGLVYAGVGAPWVAAYVYGNWSASAEL